MTDEIQSTLVECPTDGGRDHITDSLIDRGYFGNADGYECPRCGGMHNPMNTRVPWTERDERNK